MYLCCFYLIPKALSESLRKGATDCWLVSLPGVWISRRNQVLETGRFWAGHCGRRSFIYSLWHTDLCGSRNNCWNWVRLLVALVGTFISVEEDYVLPPQLLCIHGPPGKVGGGRGCYLHRDCDLRNSGLCFCIQEPEAWTFVLRPVVPKIAVRLGEK